MPIGLSPGTVKLSRFTEDWKRRYHTEQIRLVRLAGRSRHVLEHIGSTAIPGLDAKPIIDMAMRIPSFKRLPLWIKRLERAGYVYKGEYGLPGRQFFTLGNPVTHHLHLVANGSRLWDQWILFRDYLIANPAEAKRYNATKKALACKYPHNRDAYTRAKTPVINRLMTRALKTASRRPSRR